MDKRKIFTHLMLAVCVCMMSAGTFCGVHIPPKNYATTDEVSEAEVNFDDYKLRGTLYDRRMNPLTYTVCHDEDSGYHYHREFGKEYSRMFSNIIDGLSDDNTSGLDNVFEDTLRSPDPNNTEGMVGRSVILTLDSQLQKRTFYTVNDYFSKHELIGSVVIMKHNGEILSMVSLPAFDIEDYRRDENVRLLQLGRGSTENKAIISAEVPYDLFAPATETICQKNAEFMLKNYLAFDNDIPIECDFAVLDNHIDSTEGTISCSPLYLAALMREYVFGDMVKPYVKICECRTYDKSSIEGTETMPQEIATLTASYAGKVKDRLDTNAEDLGIELADNQKLYTLSAATVYGCYICGAIVDENDTENSRIYVLQISAQSGTHDCTEDMPEARRVFGDIVNGGK